MIPDIALFDHLDYLAAPLQAEVRAVVPDSRQAYGDFILAASGRDAERLADLERRVVAAGYQ